MISQDIVDIARAERETLRWILLYALWHARPYGTSEHVLLRTAHDIPLRVTSDTVRRELGYLKGKALVTLSENQPVWQAEITAEGEDVVDYRADVPPGIARPVKW
ncbi:hypothetical protein SAMN05216302_102133 [Nitrosomonas aestuarii]|uniref:Helix-turn-helix domain-containing protein n=1 Tax=Nitrosomonas aestuarii TaxID=52441 RepID=A0A1I4DKI3_9PROT|nr:cytoplasmic protein [Nitrosomonas aestuarii]SFK92536.1 hypothetical protein SAMN05216302_102133 [Nitrosomonas aestuarii]